MKKSFLFLLISIMTVFLIAGCADDTTKGDGENGETPSGTPLTPEMLEQLKGNYDVTFFGSQVINARNGSELLLGMADLAYISNDCAKAAELYPDVVNKQEGNTTKNQCSSSNQAQLLDGKVVISTDNNQISITSRMQLYSGFMEQMSPSDMYQYTEYYSTDRTSGKGVKGYTYDAANQAPSATATDFPESPYTITINSDGTVRIDMTLVGKTVSTIGQSMTVDAKNTILLKKINEDTTPLENKVVAKFPTKPEVTSK